MQTVTHKAIAKVAAVATGLAMATSMLSLAPMAHAASLTNSQVQSILSLLSSFGADSATIANVQAALTGQPTTGGTGTSTGGSTAACSFTRDLTVGSTGNDVSCLQRGLLGAGYSIPALSSGAATYGHFGSQTKTALIAWQKAAGVSPTSGYFGPISRAHWNLGGGTSSTGGSTGGGVAVGTGTGLKIQLSPTSPNNSVLVAGQGIGDLGDFVFSNPTAAPITVTGVTFNRTGVSNDSTMTNVYLYNGGTRITDSAGISNGQFSFSNSAGVFTVPAGMTYTVSVRSDIASGSNGQQIGVQLVSANVSSGALDSSVSFPINSGYQTISSANLASVVFSTSANTIPTAVATISPQPSYTVWQNSVSVSTNPVKLTSMRFTNLGSVDSTALTNLRLYVDGVQAGSAVPAMAADRTVTFDLSSAPVTLSTQTHVIKVVADVVGGSSRTFQFSLQRSSDAMMVDSQLNQPVTPNVGNSSTAFSAVTTALVTIQSTGTGGVSVSKDPSSPINSVAQGASNVKWASFDMLASGEPTKVNDLYVCASEANYGGGLANGKVFFNGVQVGFTKAIVDCTATPAGTDFSLGSSMILPAGQSATVDIYADAKTGVATSTITANTNLPNNESVTVKLVTGTSNAQGQQSLTSTGVPASTVAGNPVSITSSSLTAAKYTGYANQTVIAGTNNARLGAFTLSAGSTEDMSVNTITITASTSMASEITNLTLKDDATGAVIGTAIPTPSTSNTFSVSLTVPMSSTKTIDVYGNLLSSASVLLGLSGASTNATGATTGLSANANSIMLQSITVGSGTLNIGVGASNPVNANVIAGSSNIEVGDFTLAAVNSPFTVQKLEIDVPNTAAAAIRQLSIQYKDSTGTTQTVNQALQQGVSTSTAQFSGLTFAVPMNSSADVSVWVSTPTIASGGSALSGKKIYVSLMHSTNFQAVDGAGNATTSIGTADAFSNKSSGYGTVVVRQSIPTFAMQTITNTNPAAGQALYRVNVTADPSGAVDLDQMSFDVATSTATVKGFTLYDVTSGTAVALNAAAVQANTSGIVKVTFDNLQQVGAGSTKTYELRAASLSGWTTGASISISLAQDTTYVANAAATSLTTGNYVVWSDRSATNHATAGTAATDWTNGYLLKDFVNDVTSYTHS